MPICFYLATMKTCVLRVAFLFLTLSLISFSAQAQKDDSPAGLSKTLWPLIESQLALNPSDTSYNFILLLVRGKCIDDFNCQYDTYKTLMHESEKIFNLPVAIFIGNEIVAISQEHQEVEKEAGAHLDLMRYYDAIGNDHMAIKHADRALTLYEQAKNRQRTTYLKMFMLQKSLEYRDIDEVLPEMNALLDDAMKNGDSVSVAYLHSDLIRFALLAGHYDEAAYHIAELEKIPTHSPLLPQNYGRTFEINMGKADLARAKNQLDEAEKYYQKTLRLCQSEPDRWQEINILQSLAELEYQRDNLSLAKAYLDSAQLKAEKLDLQNLLSYNFGLKSLIAEKESDYMNALNYLKQKYAHENIFKSRSAGFDLRRHYLQLENEKIVVEKEKKSLELQFNKIRLRNLHLILGLIILLVTGLSYELYKQRKRKKELRAQNAVIQKQAEQLKSLDEIKSRFFANVSHELRTPLTLLLGPVETLLKDQDLTEKQTRLLNMAKNSGVQLEQLIDEILNLRKLEMNKMEVNAKATDLNAFFQRYFAQFESLAHRKQIDYSFEINIEDGFVGKIDEEKNRQILYNLLSNAFKFTPANGDINAMVSVSDQSLQLKVADTGAGIHPDDLPYVFDRYFQTSKQQVQASGGTGIGLALCQEYAKLFNGNISAESEPGKGSVFQITFPVERINQPAVELINGNKALSEFSDVPFMGDEIIEHIPTRPDKTKPTVLVVEDNLDLQAYICLTLKENYNVVTVDNGQLALEYLSTHDCQLILSDLMMPVMDGYQLLEKVKSDDATAQIPVIMLTARAEARDKLKALRIGVDDYLTKPFDEEELVVRINNLLERHTARRDTVENDTTQSITISQKDREWLETFEAYIHEHLSDTDLNVSSLAIEFAMSESTLLRQLKRLIGLSPVQYLQELRLDQARQYLESHQFETVKKVAYKVGYGDVRSFTRSFKKRYGKLPSSYFS